MRRSAPWRTLIAVSVAVPLALHTQSPSLPAAAAGGGTPSLSAQEPQGGLSAAEVLRLSQNANQRVIVLLRNQHPDLPNYGAVQPNRSAALAANQEPLLAELAQVHAPRVQPLQLVNGIAATVSAAEAQHLAANPVVQAVVPDMLIRGPSLNRDASAGAAPVTNSALPRCTANVELDPEALQLTHTAFKNPAIPQAQNIVTGTGVTVAFLADGVDIHNPDFIRPDGTSVFSDYQDFSGDGPNAPTDGAEAFGDASSIAAQGHETYNVNDFVNVAHRRPVPCPRIKIRGMAPGASLMGLKVFSQANFSFTSNFVQAIAYAVDHGADVINESFGINTFPDNADGPISLANDAAVAAGVTVVVSSGDAGTASTIGSPATDPAVIAAGATTQFRLYPQIFESGVQLGSGGFVDDNISSFSSGGPAQSGQKTVDVVAPGDLGWALCTPNPAVYLACTDLNGNPASIEVFGGTSESAPLTAGEAALVIQAYRQTHGGASPSPALVKTIIKSTATDLRVPSYKQGAGLINSLKAVQAARSVSDGNGSPTPQGDALLATPDTLTATDLPGTPETFTFQVTNDGARGRLVSPIVRTLGPTTSSASYTVQLSPLTNSTFVDAFGIARAYVEQDFAVPAGVQRLDAAIAWNVISQPTASPVRLDLFDPRNRFVAFSIPQDQGAPYSNSGYGHVDVRFPLAGTWRAIIWTRAGFGGSSGPVHLSISTANFVRLGSVTPATAFLQPGQTGTFTVHVSTPAQPGDQSAEVVLRASDHGDEDALRASDHGDEDALRASDRSDEDALRASDPNTSRSRAGAIPIILRSLVPLGPQGGSFSGTLTGGNGRFGAPGQTLTYQFDVPAGLHDLDLNTAITDPHYNLEGVLVDPTGLPIDVQSTVTSLDPTTGQPASYTNTLQFFRRDPPAGRWKYVLFINDNISGAQTALPFTATIVFNGASVSAQGVPNDPSVTLTPGVPVTATISVTNTGNTTKDFFVDPRLAQEGLLPLVGISTTGSLPVPLTALPPTVVVPPESTDLTIVAESMSPTVPISMDILNVDGAPPYGGTGSPDIEATSFFDPSTGQYGAAASSTAPEVAPGLWLAGPTEVGPYPDGATPSTVQVGAVALAQLFDSAALPSTGDIWALLSGQPAGPYAPLTLAPGATGTISVTITPSAAPGTVVSGFLYVDTFALDPNTLSPITFSGDELIAVPYTYTVSAPYTPTVSAPYTPTVSAPYTTTVGAP